MLRQSSPCDSADDAFNLSGPGSFVGRPQRESCCDAATDSSGAVQRAEQSLHVLLFGDSGRTRGRLKGRGEAQAARDLREMRRAFEEVLPRKPRRRKTYSKQCQHWAEANTSRADRLIASPSSPSPWRRHASSAFPRSDIGRATASPPAQRRPAEASPRCNQSGRSLLGNRDREDQSRTRLRRVGDDERNCVADP